MESSVPPLAPKSSAALIQNGGRQLGSQHLVDFDSCISELDRNKEVARIQRQKNSELDITNSGSNGNSSKLRNGSSRHSASLDDNSSARKTGRFKPPARLHESQGRRDDLMAMAAASAHGDIHHFAHNNDITSDDNLNDYKRETKKYDTSKERSLHNTRNMDEIDFESRRNHVHQIDAIPKNIRTNSRIVDLNEDDEDFEARLAADAAYQDAVKLAGDYDQYLLDHENGAFIVNDRWDSGSSHHKNSQHNSVIRRSSSHDGDDDEEEEDRSDRKLGNTHSRQKSSRNGTSHSRAGSGRRSAPFPKEISTSINVTQRSAYNNNLSADSVATPKSRGLFSYSGQSDAALMSTSHHARFYHHQRSSTNDTNVHSRRSSSNQHDHPQHWSDQEVSNHDSRRSAPRSPVRKKSVTPDDYLNHYQQQQRQIEMQQIPNSRSVPSIKVAAGINLQLNLNSGSRESSYNRLSYNSGSSQFSGRQSGSHNSAASRRRLYAEQKSVPYTKVESTQLFGSPLPPSPPRRFASPTQQQRRNNEAAADSNIASNSHGPARKESRTNGHRFDLSPQPLPNLEQSTNAPLLPYIIDESLKTAQNVKLDFSKAPTPPSFTVNPPIPPSIPDVQPHDATRWQNLNFHNQLRRSSGRGLAINVKNDSIPSKQQIGQGGLVDPDYEIGIVKSDVDLSSNALISKDNQQIQTRYNEVECVRCKTRLLTSKTTIAVECPNCSFVSPATSIASTLCGLGAVGGTNIAVNK